MIRWLLCALFVVGPTWAQGLGPNAPPGASQRYEIAKRHYRKGEFEKAAREFKAALAMHPSAKLAFNWARSAERAEKIADAIEAYRRYLELAPTAKDRGQVEKLIPVLEERLRDSYPEVAIITRPSGAQIFVDGAKEPLGAATPTTVRLRPGAHTLRFVATGHEALDRSLQVKPGTPASVEADLKPTAVKAEVKPPPPPPKSGVSALDIAGWSAVGLGAVGLGLGVFYMLETSSIADDAAGKTGDDRQALKDDFESAQTLTVLGYAAGGVLLATGVVLLVLPESDEGVSFAPTPGGGVLTVRF